MHARLADRDGCWQWFVMEWDGGNRCAGIIVSSRLALAGEFTLAELEAMTDDAGRPLVSADPDFLPVSVAALAQSNGLLSRFLAEHELRNPPPSGGLVVLE